MAVTRFRPKDLTFNRSSDGINRCSNPKHSFEEAQYQSWSRSLDRPDWLVSYRISSYICSVALYGQPNARGDPGLTNYAGYLEDPGPEILGVRL